MNPSSVGTSGTVGRPPLTIAPARDDVLPWLTDPKIALAFCPAHDFTIRNWMLVGYPGRHSWNSELAVAFGSYEFLAEIEVEQILDGGYRAWVASTRESVLTGASTTLQGAMLLGEQLAAQALCKTCNAVAGSASQA